MNTDSYLLADARTALKENRLLSALQSLQGMAATLKAWNESEELETIISSYRILLDYLTKGAEDPERKKMYHGFVRRAYELSDILERESELNNSTSFYTTRLRTLETLKGSSAPLAGFLTPQADYRNLFDAVWLSGAWSISDETSISDYLCNEEIDINRKCLVISALTLSGMRFFDIAKYRILLDYALSPDDTIRVRALTGLIFVHILHPDRVRLYPEVEARLRLMSDVPGFVRELELMQTQLFLTLETKRIEKSLQEEIIPRMMKRMENLRLDRSLGIDELKDRITEIDLNPEWEEDGTPSKLAEYMKEFVELQQRGADMYMSSFKMLKQRFPFFKEVSNWFWPFTLDHPEVPESARKNSTIKLLLGGAGLCDSDKYSFCLLADHLPQNLNAEEIQKSLSGAVGNMEELQQKMANEQPSFKDILRSYIQGFYRFCYLYLHHESFVNPFQQNLFIVDHAPFHELLNDKDFLVRMANFAFKDKSYALAKNLFERIPVKERDAALCQKLGYCLEQERNYEEASKCYALANDIKPLSEWTLRRWGTCQRMLEHYDEALMIYNELSDIQPEDSQIAFRQGECNLHLKNYDEAFKGFFKADYLSPESQQATRALAWCSLLTGKYEQAERYYQKVFEGKPSPTDYLNAGHVAWLSGHIADAVTRYKKALPQERPEKFLDEDRQLLHDSGLSDDDIAMMTDAVLM